MFQSQRRTGIVLATLSVIAAAWLSGCTPGPVGSAELGVSVQALRAADVTRVSLTVSGAGISPDIVAPLTTKNGQWSGIIGAIPAGTDRTFTAQAYDASNTLVYSGQATGVAISPGPPANVLILLQQVTPPDPFTNAAPRIAAVVRSPNEVEPGAVATVSVQATDADGDTLTYAWTATAGTLGNAAAASTTWTAPANEGSPTLGLEVSDGRGGHAGISFVMSVVRVRGAVAVTTSFNTWPVVSYAEALPGQLKTGQSAALDVTAADPDGDALSYAWTDDCGGGFSNVAARNPVWTAPGTAPASGVCTLAAVVSDGRGGSTTASVGIQVGLPEVPNAVPVIDRTYQSEGTAGPGDTVTLTVEAYDPEGTAITFHWSASGGTLGLPSTTATRSDIRWTAPSANGSFSITADVLDSDGKSTTVNFSVVVSGGNAWAGFSAGYHSLALKTDGTLFAWGYNTYGQLGVGDTTDRLTPVQVGTGYSAVSAGGVHTMALKPDGSLWAWGGNEFGELGVGDTSPRLSPVQVGTGYSTVVAGPYHTTLALKADGSLWAWGLNNSGQLGVGDTTNRSSPVQVGTGYAAVYTGGYHSLAFKTDGTLWAWGNNGAGSLGVGDTTNRLSPVQVGTGYIAVSLGSQHTTALKADGSLWVWGLNQYGQLGLGDTTDRLSPVQVGTGYTAVACEAHSTLALKADGTLWAWGYNAIGNLGLGDTTDRLSPVQVGTGYAAVFPGIHHALARKTDGSLWGWGRNIEGQLGVGDTTNRLSPVQVPLSP